MGDCMSDQYVDALKHFSKLFALWSPSQATDVKPGACGYFDSGGQWNTIADLCKPDDAEKYNFELALPAPKERSLGRWDPICSKNVNWKRVVLEAPVKLLQLNVEFKLKLEFSKNQGYGACLVTGPTVTTKYFQHPKTLFHAWAKQNFYSMSRKFLDVKDHGLWIITKVYETPRCAISSWSGAAASSCLYASVGALSGGALTLGGEIGEEQSNVLWRFLPDDDSESEGLWRSVKNKLLRSSDEKQAGPYVVFIGGLRYQKKMFGVTTVDMGGPLRGDDEAEGGFETVDDDGNQFWVTCEDWGSESRGN